MARRRPGLAAGLVLGALLAFPAGLMLGRGGDEPRGRAPPAGHAEATGMRNPYSPRVLSDPAFVAEQRRNAEALAAACERTGAYCEEAEAMRRWLSGVRSGN